ncbi:hypothetical protein [Dactylosporangium sp. NPDC051484]|uniref:hypothetical protein n=1 Tax=Dactylosporangium sp. NPDC051484 TaxID=3154942 RepID=UPI00344E18E6
MSLPPQPDPAQPQPSPYPPQIAGWPPPPLAPRRRTAVWKIVLIVVGSLFALCMGLAILGAIVGPPPAKPAAKKEAAAPPVAATNAAATSAAAVTTQAAPPPTTTAPAPPPTTTTAAAPPPSPTTTTTQPPAVKNRMICKVTEGGGTYYRYVTSASEHNFSACADGTEVPGTIDDLLLGPGNINRRCILGDTAIAMYHALVGVYSDTGTKNLAAARAYCDANGGTN